MLRRFRKRVRERVQGSWLWNFYYTRVIRRAVADSLSFVEWNLKALMYPALYSLCVILIYWDTAGRVAAQQEVSVVIVGLRAAALAFGVVLIPNLFMAPVRMESEVQWEATHANARLDTQVNENKKLTEAAEAAAQLAATTAHAGESLKPLSDDATELLLEAVKDQGGYVAKRESVAGFRIQTNGRAFGEPDNARDQAKWEGALDELWYRHLLQTEDSRVYRVTREGFAIADTLTKPDD